MICYPIEIHKKIVKLGFSAEKRVLYGKLGQYQKIRDITAGHLSFGLGQSPQSLKDYPSLCLN